MTRINDFTETTAVNGDDDEYVLIQGATTRKAKAKNITGGMIAHGAAVKAFYRYSEISLGTQKYRKICTLPNDIGGTGDRVRIDFFIDVSAGDQGVKMSMELSNTAPAARRVVSIQGTYTGSLSTNGIRVYDQVDGTSEVYIYHSGASYVGLTVDLISSGYNGIATIIPPSEVTSTGTTPTGTPSLDTTAAPYSNGVPDGNEDWNTATLLNSWVSSGTAPRYRRHSNGLVEILGTVDTGTDNLPIFQLPAGYRPSEQFSEIKYHDNATNSYGCQVYVSTGGNVTANILGGTSADYVDLGRIVFMAEA